MKITPETERILGQLRAWRARAAAGRAYTLQLGADVELFLNGREMEPAAIRVGDRVGVKVAPEQESKDVLAPEHVRVSRPPAPGATEE